LRAWREVLELGYTISQEKAVRARQSWFLLPFEASFEVVSRQDLI